jgi:hypothetical protein
MSSSVYIPSTSGGGGSTPPTSISIKTASYTIPVGKYAFVQIIAKDITIDGVITAQLVASASRSLTASNTLYDSISAANLSGNNYFAKFTCSSTASSSGNSVFVHPLKLYADGIQGGFGTLAYGYGYSSNASFTGSRSAYFGSFIDFNARDFSAGTLSTYTIGGIGVQISRTSGTVTYSLSVYSAGTESFWVTSGTVLSGTNYIVTEYAI